MPNMPSYHFPKLQCSSGKININNLYYNAPRFNNTISYWPTIYFLLHTHFLPHHRVPNILMGLILLYYISPWAYHLPHTCLLLHHPVANTPVRFNIIILYRPPCISNSHTPSLLHLSVPDNPMGFNYIVSALGILLIIPFSISWCR
jgi:hypothetical protein